MSTAREMLDLLTNDHSFQPPHRVEGQQQVALQSQVVRRLFTEIFQCPEWQRIPAAINPDFHRLFQLYHLYYLFAKFDVATPEEDIVRVMGYMRTQLEAINRQEYRTLFLLAFGQKVETLPLDYEMKEKIKQLLAG